MNTEQNVLYASQARPWLKYYDKKYLEQKLPEMTAFDYVCHQNKNRLGEVALDYYGRVFTYADLMVNVNKTAAAFRGLGVKKGDIITVVSVMTPEVQVRPATAHMTALEARGMLVMPDRRIVSATRVCQPRG